MKSLTRIGEQIRCQGMTAAELVTVRQIAADYLMLIDEICKLSTLNQGLRDENAELKDRLSKRSKRTR